MRKSHMKLLSCTAVVLLLAVLATSAMADGWPRPDKYEYTRELFTGSFPVVNNTVELLVVQRNIVGDRISSDESKIYVPAGEKVRFHVTSLDADYVVKIEEVGHTNPLLEVAVSGGGQAEDTLRRGLGLKEVREVLLLKDGKYLVGGDWKVVPEG